MYLILRRLTGPSMVLALAIALAACGSSSSSTSSAATSTGTSTPAAPSTPNGTGSTSSGAALADSTSVSDPKFRAALIAIFTQQRVTPAPQTTAVVDCVIKDLPGIDIKNRGAFDSSSNTSKVQTLINSCIGQVMGK